MSNNNLPGENSEFWKSPALKGLDEKCPAHFRGRVPVRIRMLKNVHSAFFGGNGPGLFAECGKVFEAWTNRYGAVAAVFPDGQMLGVKPDEFEVVEWYDLESKSVVRDDREIVAELKAQNAELLETLKIAKEAIRQQKCTCSLAGRTCYRCYASEKINQAIAKVEGE